LAFARDAVPPATACERALMSACSAIIIPVESNFIQPARCYPNGYTDKDGVKHDRPDCVKFGGDGTRVPEDENAPKASVENLAAKIKILQTNAKNWRRLYGRHGWRPHAAGHARCVHCCLHSPVTSALQSSDTRLILLKPLKSSCKWMTSQSFEHVVYVPLKRILSRQWPCLVSCGSIRLQVTR
jgi:hypothetical protein